MASDSSGRTFQEYLEHHLQNLVYGKLPEGYERINKDGTTEVLQKDTWTLAQGKAEVAEEKVKVVAVAEVVPMRLTMTGKTTKMKVHLN